MRPRDKLAVVALALLTGVTVWLHDRDRKLTRMSHTSSDDTEINAPARPAPPPAPESLAAMVQPHGDDAGALSPALKQALYEYNEVKKTLLFRDDLDREAAARFAGKNMLTVAARFLTESSQEDAYSSEHEDMRVTLIDYVGDASLGRFSFEDRGQASLLLRWLLDMPLSLPGKDGRQVKSLIGDRIDLMAYYTQLDIGRANEYLVRHRGEDIYKHLEVGYSNGLYWLGYGEEEIERALADTR